MMKIPKLILVTLMCDLLISAVPQVSPKIIAHRGASDIAPENTIAAVKLGYELGADAVEIDVHMTKDNKVVAVHDGTTARTAPGTDFSIKETDAEVLRSLDVGIWKDEKFKGEKIPFIEEILEIVPENKTLVIEVKSDTATLPYLLKEVEESGIEDRLILISFNKEVVVQWKKMMPEMPVFWLLGSFNEHSQEEAIKIAKENNLEGLNVNYRLITPEFMQKMKEANLQVYVYTVNNAVVAKDLKEAKVDGITTDRPEWIRNSIQ